jgi:hypothetical protein
MGRYVGTPEHAIGMKSCGAPAQLKKMLKILDYGCPCGGGRQGTGSASTASVDGRLTVSPFFQGEGDEESTRATS